MCSGLYQPPGGVQHSAVAQIGLWRLIVWGSAHFLSLRATHVAGILNRGADLLSRGNPLCEEWRLHPKVVAQVWRK